MSGTAKLQESVIEETPPVQEEEDNINYCDNCGEAEDDCGCNDDGDCCECEQSDCESCAASVGGVVSSDFKEFAEYLQKRGFHYVDRGAFRHVWMRGKIVIKIPRVGDGINDNIIEARAWRKYRSNMTNLGIYLAPCRLLPNGCLMMPKMTFDYLDKVPAWANKIDGGQVAKYCGMNGKETPRFVAYDFALSVAERAQWEDEMGVCSEFYGSSSWRHTNERGAQARMESL